MDKMLRRSLVLVILFVGCLLTSGVEAATLEVGSGFPYPSIQAAINAAVSGEDTVLVHDGTYVENISFSGKAITVKSANGAASTIIDGNGSGTVVTFSSGEGSGSVLDGFTITNGYVSGGWGGGILCYYYSSPTITNCIITGNTAYHGGGIDCESNSSPTIINCTISGNTGYVGGGIFCKSASSPTITNCTISGNTGTAHSGAIGCDSGCNPIISNCILSGNTAGAGGGIYSYLSSPTIINCTISGNTATNNGGGIYCESNSSASVKNTILWGDVPNEIYLVAGSSITVTYSDVNQDGYAGSNGNIRQDPLFVDLADGDFSLQSISPCIDAGTSDGAPPTDMKGNPRFDPPQIPNTGGGTYPYYDMGALEYVDSGWDWVDPPSVSFNWYLYSVHFSSATEGWAVGFDNFEGALFHYSGGTWTSVTPPSVTSSWGLSGVHFTSAKDGWAVGWSNFYLKGALLHYSFWPETFNSKLSIKGFAKDSNPTEGECHIYSDGKFYLYEDDHGTPRYYTGTYGIDSGKTILFTLDSNGLSAMQAMLGDRVTKMGADKGVTVENISFVLNPVSSFKGSIKKKTNAPSKLTIKITGTVNGLFDGVDKTMSFTYQNNVKYYSP